MNKIQLSYEQRKWLLKVKKWIEARGPGNTNLPITVEDPKGSGRIVFINEPYYLLFTILKSNQYLPNQKTNLNLLGVAYLWDKKEKK